MKSTQLRLAAVLLAACFLLTLFTPILTAATKLPPPPPDRRKLVKSVDAANNNIEMLSMSSKKLRTYHLDDLTAIKLDGSPAKFSDIKAGMEIVDYLERDSDNLDSVNLLSKTHAPTNKEVGPSALTGDADKTIQAVMTNGSSIVIFFTKSKLERTYHIDGNTALTVNGVNGTFSQIKPGMQVKDYAERDNDDLDSLTVTGY